MRKAVPVILFAFTCTLWGLTMGGVTPKNCTGAANSAAAAFLVLGGTRWKHEAYTRDPVVRRLADTVLASRRTKLQKTAPLRVVR
jgi:hypothetical protein